MSVIESINREVPFSTIEHLSEHESGIEWCFMHRESRPGYRPCFSEPLPGLFLSATPPRIGRAFPLLRLPRSPRNWSAAARAPATVR